MDGMNEFSVVLIRGSIVVGVIHCAGEGLGVSILSVIVVGQLILCGVEIWVYSLFSRRDHITFFLVLVKCPANPLQPFDCEKS